MHWISHRNQGFQSFVVVLCSFMLLLSGCTSLHAYSPERAAADEQILKVGSEVEVTLKDGGFLRGTVSELDAMSFNVVDESGTINEQVKFDDIELIEVRKISLAKTAGLSFLILIGVMAAALSSVDCFAFCFGDN